jgi:hypothetical protein
VRLCAAYYIANPPSYALALWAHIAFAAHGASEAPAFRTVRVGIGAWISLITGTGELLWMLSRLGAYVGRASGQWAIWTCSSDRECRGFYCNSVWSVVRTV